MKFNETYEISADLTHGHRSTVVTNLDPPKGPMDFLHVHKIIMEAQIQFEYCFLSKWMNIIDFWTEINEH